MQPLLEKLHRLTQSKSGRIKLAAGTLSALVLLGLLIHLFSTPTAPVIPIQTEQVAAAPLPPAPPNADNSKIILELFNPSDASLTHQQNETTISQQIEQTLTVTFVLTKCLIISQDDYSDIFRALIFYAEKVKLAPDEASAIARVREIAESSKASYALVYSRTSCEDPHLPVLADDIAKWTKRMFTQ